jgi:hypothetical protein
VVYRPVNVESLDAWIERSVAEGLLHETSLEDARGGALVRFSDTPPDVIGIYTGKDEEGTPKFLAPAGETLGHPIAFYELPRDGLEF